jgi:hypothetical protein
MNTRILEEEENRSRCTRITRFCKENSRELPENTQEEQNLAPCLLAHQPNPETRRRSQESSKVRPWLLLQDRPLRSPKEEFRRREGGGEGCSGGARWCVSVKVVASPLRGFNYGMQRFGKLLVAGLGMRRETDKRSEVVLEKDASALKIQAQVRDIHLRLGCLSSSFLIPSV